MNLLLAALKKTEENGTTKRGLAELQLEALPEPLPHQASVQVESGNNPISSPDGASKTDVARTKEKNLFAAKTIAPNKRWRLGIIPISLIGGGIVAAVGSLYVYYQISPSPRPPIATQNMAVPVATPAPIVATAIALLPPSIPPLEMTSPIAANEESGSTLPASKIIKTTMLNIHHQPKPDAIDLILASAYQAYQNGDVATAGEYYRNALAQDKNNRDALLGLAAIAQQQGQDEIALQYYRRVLLLDPRDPVAQAALTSFDTGDSASHESHLHQLIAQQPDSAALHFALGNHYADQSRWTAAQQEYLNALAAEPGNALFAFNLAISLDHLGQRNAAAQYYQQALQLDTSGHSGFIREQAQLRINHLASP